MERDQLASILHRTQDEREDDYHRLKQHMELQLNQQLQQQYRLVGKSYSTFVMLLDFTTRLLAMKHLFSFQLRRLERVFLVAIVFVKR